VRRGARVAALILAASLLAGFTDPAPRLGAQSLLQLPRPLPAPYDPGADAAGAVDAALARSRKSGKPVVLDFGANWCVDCRVFAGVLALPEMRRYVARNFELVTIDVGQFDRNLEIAGRYGVKLTAVPAVLVVEARTGKLRNRRNVLGIGDARTMQPQQMADWLAKWAN
jgi:thiol:disulfide interchange protein